MFKLMIHSLSTYLAYLCSTGYDCGSGTCYFSNRVVQCACPPGFYGDRCESKYDIIINIIYVLGVSILSLFYIFWV